jgi:hypothetical protein
MPEINCLLGRQSQGVAEFFYTGPCKISFSINNMFEKGRGIYFHLFRKITVGKISGAPFAFLIIMKQELSVVYKFKYCFHRVKYIKTLVEMFGKSKKLIKICIRFVYVLLSNSLILNIAIVYYTIF